MTILEEAKEIVRNFRETNDFDSFKKAMYDLDIEKDRSEQDNEAMVYLFKNITIDEIGNLF